ncbi:MAG: ABC transporter substrate-binding protein, partial [Pseudolabrys sp.]
MIGVLRNTSKSDAAFRLAAFREGLKELGFVEGHNVEIEYRYADSKYDRLAELANELVHRSVSVLFASGNASALAAKRATSTIPVVFAVGNDPVEMGLVNSLSRPNGNVTGVSFFTTLVGKRLELMRELTSPSATIAFLQDTNNLKTTAAECPLLGVKRTSRFAPQMSANDPKRTCGQHSCCSNEAR